MPIIFEFKLKNMETYLVFVGPVRNSNKFWSAKVSGSNLTVELVCDTLSFPPQLPYSCFVIASGHPRFRFFHSYIIPGLPGNCNSE